MTNLYLMIILFDQSLSGGLTEIIQARSYE
jgi:hypothetical protein